MSELCPIALNFDGSLPLQPTLMRRMRRVVNLESDENRLRLFANRSGVQALRLAIGEIAASLPGPFLTFFGSGDFHHVTLALLEKLAAISQPLHLVLIDNHPDWFNHWPRFHCGNWLSSALKLDGVKSVTLIGQNSADVATWKWYSIPHRDIASGRLTLFPYAIDRLFWPLTWAGHESAATLPEVVAGTRWGTEIPLQTLVQIGARGVFSGVANTLRDQNVYISIDKDCLAAGDAATDWDQGRLSLGDLVSGVRLLAGSCRLVGADVCGDRAGRPLKGLFKRLDAGRLFKRSRRLDAADSELNQRANLALLEAFGARAAEEAS